MEEYISMSRKISGQKDLASLMREIETTVPESGSVDQQWTLSDLENVVYEFVNYNGKKQEFLETKYKNQDVSKEDLMKI